jgi:hypothetical protein
MFCTVGSWLADPVVCVRVAGGALLGTELCCGCSLAGRVAVVGGDEASSADATDGGMNRGKATTASAASFIVLLPNAGDERRLCFSGQRQQEEFVPTISNLAKQLYARRVTAGARPAMTNDRAMSEARPAPTSPAD